MEKARDDPSKEFGNQEPKGGYSESTKRQKESPLCYIDGHMPPQMRSWNPNYKKIKGRVVLRGDIVKHDSGSHAVFLEQGSPATQTTAAAVDKEWKIPAWQLGKVKSKKEVILEAQRAKKKVHLGNTNGHVSPQECGVGTKITKIQR